MSYRVLIAGTVLSVLIVSTSPTVVSVAGQTPEDALTATWPPPPNAYTPPRTPWGDPDLVGTWDTQSRIPMERPEDFEGKPVLTDQEWAEWEEVNSVSNWNQQNFVRDRRTSLVVDPPDGRIPPLTPEAVERIDAYEAVRSAPGRGPYDSWEDFRTIGRCIAAHTPRSPRPDGPTRRVGRPSRVRLHEACPRL